MSDAIVIGSIAGVVVGAVALMIWAESRRRKAIQALFSAQGDQVWIKPTADVQGQALQAVGSPPEMKDGPTGVKWAAELNSTRRPAWVVEHSYSRGSGKSRRTYNHTMVATQVPAGWATTTITRRSLWNKLAALVGRKDMQLDNEAFNKAFHVTTDDENFALVFLTPELQEWLLATPPDWTVRVTGGMLQIFVARAAAVKKLPLMLRAPDEVLARTTRELFDA